MFFKNDPNFIPANLETLFYKLYGTEDYWLFKKNNLQLIKNG